MPRPTMLVVPQANYAAERTKASVNEKTLAGLKKIIIKKKKIKNSARPMLLGISAREK